jgi:prophage maintenance system killer protein
MMVPPPEALALAYPQIASELGLSPRASNAALRITMREADHLANDVYDVPASLLFALGRYPRCFAGFRTMSVLLVQWYTKTLGFKLEATARELGDVLVAVALGEMTHEDVAGWVGARMLPFGG